MDVICFHVPHHCNSRIKGLRLQALCGCTCLSLLKLVNHTAKPCGLVLAHFELISQPSIGGISGMLFGLGGSKRQVTQVSAEAWPAPQNLVQS